MTSVGEAAEGVVTLVMGGFVLLLVGSALDSTVGYNLDLWGILLMLLGVVFGIGLVAVVLGELLGR